MRLLRGLFCVLALPFHTTVLALVATLIGPFSPGGVLAVGRLWSRIVLRSAGVRVRGLHAERAERGGPWIVLCSHQSLFDIPALLVSLPGDFGVVAKRALFHIPFFGWALRVAGFISIDRSRRDRAIASLSLGARTLQGGRSLVIFAEGTRSRDGRLQPLKRGPFHLAQQARVPLLPVTFSGSRAVLPRQGWIPRPGNIDVHFGRPLPAIPEGAPIDSEVVGAAAAALEAGYTERHRYDLDDTARPLRRSVDTGTAG